MREKVSSYLLCLALWACAPHLRAAAPVLIGCSSDSLGDVVASSGYWDPGFDVSDIEPLCSGWVLLADKTSNRVLLVDVVRGQVSTSYPLSTAPGALGYDPDNGWAWASLSPATLLAKIDLTSGTVTAIPVVGAATNVSAGDGYAFTTSGDQWSTRIELVSGFSNALAATKTAYYNGTVDYNTVNNTLYYSPSGISSGPFSLYSFASPPNLSLSFTGPASAYAGMENFQSPDGASFISAQNEYFLDSSGAQRGHFPSQNIYYATTMAYQPQGQLVAAADSDYVGVFDAVRHVRLDEFTVPAAYPSDVLKVRFSRGGELLFTLQRNGNGLTRVRWKRVSLAAYTTPTPVPAGPQPVWTGCNTDPAPSGPSSGLMNMGGRIADVVSLCGGNAAVAMANRNEVDIVNAPGGTVYKRIPFVASPGRLALDPSRGELLVAFSDANLVARVNLATGSVAYVRTRYMPAGVAAGNCGTFFVSTVASTWWDSEIEVIDGTNTSVFHYNIGYETDIAFDRLHERILAAVTNISSDQVWTLDHNPVSHVLTVTATASNVVSYYTHPVISPDGQKWSFGPRGTGAVDLLMSSPATVLGQYVVAGYSVQADDYSPGGALLATVDGGNLQFFRTSDHVNVGTFSSGISNDLDRVSFSRGGKLAIAAETVYSSYDSGRLFWAYPAATDSAGPGTAWACTTFTITPTLSPSFTPSPSGSATPTASPSRTATPSATVTVTPSASPTLSVTATASPTRTVSPTATASPSASATLSPSLTPSPSPTRTASPSATPTGSPSMTAAPTETRSPSAVPSPSATVSATASPPPASAVPPIQDRLLPVYPNPFRPAEGRLRLDFELAQPGTVWLRVFDLRGTQVAVIEDGVFHGAGRYQDSWDGQGGGGGTLASGLYLVHFKTATAHDLRRVVLVR